MMLALLAAIYLAAPSVQPFAESPTDTGFQGVLERCVWIKREIQMRLLEPEPEVLVKNAELLALEGTGATRLIDRQFQDQAPGRAILKRGGGAYYSFATRSHSYNSEPDLSFDNGQLNSGFYGLSFGAVYRLGPVDLAKMDTSGGLLPEGISEAAAEAWPTLWAPIEPESAMNREQQRDPFWQHTENAGAIGSTYILRAWLHEEHDILVAFRLEAKGPYGVTIVWRELKSFPMDRRSANTDQDRHAEISDAPPESELGVALRDLSLKELFEKLDAEVENADLYSVPEPQKERYFQGIGKAENLAQREGFLRLFDRGKAAGILGDNMGCYFSFARGEHGWVSRPEIGLEGGRLNGGYHRAWVVDFGALSMEEVASAMSGTCPQSVDGPLAQGWDALHKMSLVANERRELVPSDNWPEKLAAAGVLGSDPRRPERALVVEGHTYLFRTAGSQGDLLLALTVIQRDSVSASFAWRLLESFPVSQDR